VKYKYAKAQKYAEQCSFISYVAKEGIFCFSSMDDSMKHECFHEVRKFSRSMDSFLYESGKRREGVFSPKAQKRYVYKSFMHRKE
jgi:hypothetical protein